MIGRSNEGMKEERKGEKKIWEERKINGKQEKSGKKEN